MATLYITEFADLAFATTPAASHAPRELGQAAQQAPGPVAEQTVAIGGSSTQSNAFNAATTLVRIHTDSVCSILFGNSPTVTTSSARLASGQTEYFGVYPGTKVAVISNT